MIAQPANTATGRRSDQVSEVDAVMLFAADIRTGFLLLNEARYRTIERFFGASRTQANMVTLIGIAALAEAAHDKLDFMLHAPGAGPTRADGVLGGAVVEELLHDVGGPASRATPFLGALVLLGLLHGRTRPVLFRTMNVIGTASRNLHQSFELHYRRRVQPTSLGRALTAARDAVGGT
jgi:hypothetical protein